MARDATGWKNTRLARRRPRNGTWFSLQIQRCLPDCLLGDFLCAVSYGTFAFAKTRPMACDAGFFALRIASHHLERAAQLDHLAPRCGQRRTSRPMASDAPLLLGFYFPRIRAAQSD